MATTANTAHMPERDAPARGIRHRHGHERRREGRHRHGRRVDRGHQPDAIGEVLLHQRRQQDVADADGGEDHGCRDQQRERIGRETAPDHADDGDDHRREREPLEPEPALELRGQDAEDRRSSRRRRADQADDRRRHRESRRRSSASTGDSEATAERSENANRTMPTRARALPCQRGREGVGLTDSA